jgi:hypothetical protein
VCVRGASALADALAAHPGADAFVIWEPVLPADGAPTPSLALFGDRRVHRFWDPSRALSTRLAATKIRAECLATDEAGAVWDVLFVYSRGSTLEQPKYCGRPVVRVTDHITE